MLSQLLKEGADQVAFELKDMKKQDVSDAPRPVQESAGHVTLATFDNAAGTTYSWHVMNDPVMGGQSHSKFFVDHSSGYFEGKCAIVKFLNAPGFCKISTQHSLFRSLHFADASSFIDGALYLDVQTTTPEYKGFFIGFGAKGAKRPSGAMHHAAPSFKANFQVPGTKRTTVKVPFNGFSVDWSDFTGRCDTKDPNNGFQHHCCSSEHPEVCPTAEHLSQITGLEVWAEGVEGDFQLQIFSISAGPLKGEAPATVV